MIDTHCHLLPGLDDGPATEIDSVQMARGLTKNGVRLTVCTPHRSSEFQTEVADAVGALERLREHLAVLRVPLELRLSAEFSPQQLVAEDEAGILGRTLGPGHVLVELRRTTSAALLEEAAERLASLGLRPVLAHPERCSIVQRDPAFLDGMRDWGALVQIVVPSLVETPDSRVAATAWNLLESGRADLVASDAHKPRGARVRLAAIAELLATRYGAGTANELLEGTPARILESAPASPTHGATRYRPVRP